MNFAQRLKRVFGIDLQTCAVCGGALRIIAGIEDPAVIDKILARLDARGAEAHLCRLPPCRAPPAIGLRRFPRSGLFDPASLLAAVGAQASAGDRLRSRGDTVPIAAARAGVVG